MNMMKRLLGVTVFTFAALSLAACGSGGGGQSTADSSLTVSAASSLTDVMKELGTKFELQHPGAKVDFNFGSSGDLEKQIVGGAPVDVFMAASTKEIDDLKQKNMLAAGTLITPVGNELVMVAPMNSNLNLTSPADLTSDQVNKVAIGNPDTVPAGRYAKDALTYYGVWDALQTKIVMGENVRQVLDYVARGEVDAGFVYTTDADTRKDQVKIAMTTAPESHKPIVYPMAVISGSQDETLARQFLDFVNAPENEATFTKYGFKILNG